MGPAYGPRATRCFLAAVFCGYLAAASLNLSWTRDMEIVGIVGLLLLGLPVSLTFVAANLIESDLALSLPVALSAAEGVLCLLLLPYLQHFVWLPRLLTERRAAPPTASG